MINNGPVNIDLCGLPLWAFNLRAKFLDLFKDAIGLMTMGLIRKLLLPTTWSYFYIYSTSKKNICWHFCCGNATYHLSNPSDVAPLLICSLLKNPPQCLSSSASSLASRPLHRVRRPLPPWLAAAPSPTPVHV